MSPVTVTAGCMAKQLLFMTVREPKNLAARKCTECYSADHLLTFSHRFRPFGGACCSIPPA